jgi:dolichol-phosphate mannosyltransferase
MPPSIDPKSASNQTVHVSENARPGPELAIVIPTFNERDNIKELLDRLETTLEGCHWEAIFVDDDSPDRTSDVVREIAGRDHRIRTIRRIGRRGLSTACIEGMLSSSAPYLAVMDGDLQHDEKLLPEMLAALRANRADIVIGSRYTSGGGVGTWSESRATLSRLATRLSRFVVKEKLTDPMSGFFVIRNEAFRGAVRNLSGVGFKILLDLFASSPTPLRFEEMPYEFRNRQAGESKLDNQVAWEYGMLLLDKLVGHILPVRFVAFTLVGAVGIGVHLIVQGILFAGLNRGFVTSQAAATLVAMTFNFALNNVLTYRDMRLRGWQWLRGWASFTIACSVGAFANVGIAAYIFSLDTQWVLAAICGIVVGAVWNYAVTMVYTWKKPRDSR